MFSNQNRICMFSRIPIKQNLFLNHHHIRYTTISLVIVFPLTTVFYIWLYELQIIYRPLEDQYLKGRACYYTKQIKFLLQIETEYETHTCRKELFYNTLSLVFFFAAEESLRRQLLVKALNPWPVYSKHQLSFSGQNTISEPNFLFVIREYQRSFFIPHPSDGTLVGSLVLYNLIT